MWVGERKEKSMQFAAKTILWYDVGHCGLRRSGGMADATVLKTVGGNSVRVRIPPPAPHCPPLLFSFPDVTHVTHFSAIKKMGHVIVPHFALQRLQTVSDSLA